MRRRNASGTALLPLVLALWGCQLDLVTADGEASVPASLTILLITEGRGDSVDLRAAYHGGTDERGRPREIPDPALRVGGSTVSPDEVERGAFRYSVTVPRGAGRLEVAAPEVSGRRERSPTLAISPLWTSSGDTIVFERAGQVGFPIHGRSGGSLGRGIEATGLERSGYSEASTGWQIRVATEDGWALTLESRSPGDPIAFPASLLPEDFRTGTASMLYSMSDDLESNGGEYRVDVQRLLRREVHVRVAPSGS